MIDKRVLIIAADAAVRCPLEEAFKGAGAKPFVATDGQEGLRSFYEYRPDLVVLDLQLSQEDGWQLCQQIRLLADIPIVILSAEADEEAELRALHMGDADYVPYPLKPAVALAPARRLLGARNGGRRGGYVSYRDDRLHIDLRRRRLFVEGEPVPLTKTEYRLLAYLLRHAGHVLSHERILEKVWGPGYEAGTACIHVYISRLRQKLEQDPGQPGYIVTQYGVGYCFRSQQDGHLELSASTPT